MVGLFYFIQPVQGVWTQGLIGVTQLFMLTCQKKAWCGAPGRQQSICVWSGGRGWDRSVLGSVPSFIISSWEAGLVRRPLERPVGRQVRTCVSGSHPIRFCVCLGIDWVNLDGKAKRKCFDDVSDLCMNDSSFCFQTSSVLSRCLNFLFVFSTRRDLTEGRGEEKLLTGVSNTVKTLFCGFSFELAFGKADLVRKPQ